MCKVLGLILELYMLEQLPVPLTLKVNSLKQKYIQEVTYPVGHVSYAV